MKTPRRFLTRPLALAVAVCALATLGASHAHAQAKLTFSGGNGTPLNLTLTAPVSYVVTTAASVSTPYFDLVGLGNIVPGGVVVSGTITYTIASGTPKTLSGLASGLNSGVQTPNDPFLYGATQTLAAGNVIVLNAGTLTTNGPYAGAPPAGGSFTTFIVGNFPPADVSTNGLAVPEPSVWALLGVGAAGFGLVTLRRRVWRA